MVQNIKSGRGHYRPTKIDSPDNNDDDRNRTRRLCATDSVPNAGPMGLLQAMKDLVQDLKDDRDIRDVEVTYLLNSGKAFQITKAHPEPQEVRVEDILKPRRSLSSVKALDQGDTTSESGQTCGLPSADRRNRTPKRKRRGSSSPNTALRRTRRHVNRRRGEDSESEDELEGGYTETQLIKVSELLSRYYIPAFRSINQLACKDIVKVWIRYAQPKKQTTHPYNGGRSVAEKRRSIDVHGYLGHYTMPGYWPSDAGWKDGLGCRHREPDHVKKPERLILLVHLIRSQGKGFEDGDFNLETLKQSTESIHLESGRKHWKPEYVDRLNEIYRVREQEMQYERGEIDEDTLISVEMPKPRCKNRKARKSAVTAVSPSSEQVKQDVEERSPSACNAPIANMGITTQTEEEEVGASAGCDPSMLSVSSSSTEEVASDASSYEPGMCKSRTPQHGLPVFDSPSPTGRPHNLVQGNWFQQSANFRQDPTTFARSDTCGPFATPSEVQRVLPFRDQYRPGSPSTTSHPNQDLVHRQYDHDSANRMRPNRISTRSPSSRPCPPKTENVCHQTFAGSSTGFAGLWGPDADHLNWQTQNLWDAQIEPATYMDVADPGISFLPATNGSFGGDYGGASFSFGMQPDTWNDGNQALVPPNHHSLDEGIIQQRLNLQAVNAPQYQISSMNCGNPDLADQFLYTTDFNTHTPAGTEDELDPFSQQQQRQPESCHATLPSFSPTLRPTLL